MNQQETELLDSFDRLSLSSLSKSSPSTFTLKPSRLLSTSSNKPSNLSHVPCKFFKQGTCTAGANCIFSHNPDPTSESSVCKYFRKGNCKFGTKCALLHTMSPYTTTVNKPQSQQLQPQQQHQQASRLVALDENHSLGQERDCLMDPFATSAPSQSPFSLLSLSDERLRVQQPTSSSSNSSNSNDPLVQLMETSPFQQRPYLMNSAVNSIHINNNSNHSNSNNSSNSSHSNRIMQQQPLQLHSIPESNTHTFEDQDFFDDVNDFMLPSSLNDLLTPTELRKQQQFPSYLSSSGASMGRQPSFEPMGTSSSLSSSWNVPFYNSHGPITNHGNYSYDDTPQQPYFANAINIPGDHSNNTANNNSNNHGPGYHNHFSNTTITNTNTSAALVSDEDGPFIMEDTIEPDIISTTTTITSINNNQNSTEKLFL